MHKYGYVTYIFIDNDNGVHILIKKKYIAQFPQDIRIQLQVRQRLPLPEISICVTSDFRKYLSVPHGSSGALLVNVF